VFLRGIPCSAKKKLTLATDDSMRVFAERGEEGEKGKRKERGRKSTPCCRHSRSLLYSVFLLSRSPEINHHGEFVKRRRRREKKWADGR